MKRENRTTKREKNEKMEKMKKKKKMREKIDTNEIISVKSRTKLKYI